MVSNYPLILRNESKMKIFKIPRRKPRISKVFNLYLREVFQSKFSGKTPSTYFLKMGTAGNAETSCHTCVSDCTSHAPEDTHIKFPPLLTL